MTAKILRDKFEADLKALQNICPHTEASEWMDYCYAPGHFAGMVKVCVICDQILERNPPSTYVEPEAFDKYSDPSTWSKSPYPSLDVDTMTGLDA